MKSETTLSPPECESSTVKVTITSTCAECVRLLLCGGVKLDHASMCACMWLHVCPAPRPHKHVSGLHLITCQMSEAPASGGNGGQFNVKHVKVITAERSSDRLIERRVSASFTHPNLFTRTSALRSNSIYLARV